MPAPTILCPSCGAENQRERTACFKCYAPLREGSTSRPSKAAKSAVGSSNRPLVAVKPLDLLRNFLEVSKTEPLYQHAVTVLSLLALTWCLIAAANFNVLPATYSHISALGLLSLGMTAAVLTGGVDLSLGPIAAVAGALALLSRPYGAVFALTIALLSGLALGLLNGFLVSRKERASATLVTLCTGSAVAALLLAYNLGEFSSEGFSRFEQLSKGGLAGFPFSLLLLLAAAVIGNSFLNGVLIKPSSDPSKPSTFEDSEIVSAYTFGGFTAGLAGALLAASNNTPREIVFSAWYLMPLASILLGGALLRERKATVPAAVVGTLILGSVTSHMQTLGLPAISFFLVAVAIVLISSVDTWKQVSSATAWELARANPLKAAQGASGFGLMLVITGGISGNLISRVPAHSAIVIQASGKLRYRSKGSDLWNEARGRVVLHDGDDIYTDPNSAALLKLSDDSVIKVAANTQMRLDQIALTQTGHSASRMVLSMGRIYCKVKESVENMNDFEVQTPTAVAAVRGTVWSVASNESKDYVSVRKGTVDVGSVGLHVSVTEGLETTVPRNAPPAKPREMSEAEKSAWAREVPVLENPLEQRIWESNLSEDFMGDNFDDGLIDPALWFLRAGAEAKDVVIREGGGALMLGGMPPQRRGMASYGVVTPSFPQGSFEASALVRPKHGDGTPVFRLVDSSGRGTSAALTMDPQKGYDLVSPGASDLSNRHVPVFGDERNSYHRLSLAYDAGARIVRAYVDDMSLGYAEVDFGENMHLELVYEGRNLREGIDCRYDTFTTNIPLPRNHIIQTVVAAINPTSGASPRMVLAVAPLSGKSGGLASVKVQYPRKALGAGTRLFVSGIVSANMKRRNGSNKVWVLDERGALPGTGDYIFRFKGTDRRQWTAWQRMSDSEFPQLLNFRDGDQGGSVVVAWDPIPTADSYWAEIVDADNKVSLFNSSLLTDTHAVINPSRLKSGTRYFVTVVAHLPSMANSTASLQQWRDAVELVRPWFEASGNGFINVSNPTGKDKFAYQCGQLRTR